MKIGVVGFPGLYGGAGVELDHQLTLWSRMGYKIHVVPTGPTENEPLLHRTRQRAIVHNPKDYMVLEGMPVVSFCCDEYLKSLPEIHEIAAKTIWVNCMTWLFGDEKKAHENGLIDLFLYQSPHQWEAVKSDLENIGPVNHQLFRSWFDVDEFPFHANRSTDRFRFGRISREDADKYAGDTLWVYETMVAPVAKSGVILGFDSRSEGKIGKPPDWIRTYPGGGISQREFYAHSSCVIQGCDTHENWPRVGLEAMASGSVLIVDDRGGWKGQVEHGVTGWLCKNSREFVYYSSRMAYEPAEREAMAFRARRRLRETLVDTEGSMMDWEKAFSC